MDATETADKLVAWAVETCPTLNSVYDHDPTRIQHALPVAVAGIEREAVTSNDPTLGIPVTDMGLDQADVHLLHSTLMLMVDDTPDQAAAEQLEGFVAALGASIKGDDTLGGRVPACSVYWSASYEPPYVEFDDGTRARVATFSLTVAELT